MSIIPATLESFISVDVETADQISQNIRCWRSEFLVFFTERDFCIELKLVNQNFHPEALESCGFSMENQVEAGTDPSGSILASARY